MDWIAFNSARQLLAEERVGVPKRAHDRAEQADIEATKAAMRKHSGPPVKLEPRKPLEVVPEPLILAKGETKRGKVA